MAKKEITINCDKYEYTIKYKKDTDLQNLFCNGSLLNFQNKNNDICYFYFGDLQSYTLKDDMQNELFDGSIEIRTSDFVNLGISEVQYDSLMGAMGLGVGLSFVFMAIILASFKIKIWDS